MTPDDIKNIMKKEVDSLADKPELHWINFQRCLVTPYKITAREQIVKDGNRIDQLEEVWIVFEERAGDSIGYKIYYDEGWGEFGLMTNGLKDDQYPVILGIYGSFLDTLKAM
jgi:hypothetical protein